MEWKNKEKINFAPAKLACLKHPTGKHPDKFPKLDEAIAAAKKNSSFYQ